MTHPIHKFLFSGKSQVLAHISKSYSCLFGHSQGATLSCTSIIKSSRVQRSTITYSALSKQHILCFSSSSDYIQPHNRKRTLNLPESSVKLSATRSSTVSMSTSKGHNSNRGTNSNSSDVLMQAARSIFEHAVDSVLPHQMIQKNLHYDSDSSLLRVENREYQLNRNVYVVGLGKAVLGMARALEDCIGSHIVRGVISVPLGSQKTLEAAGKREMLVLPTSAIRVMEGADNNLPDEAAQEAAREITKLAESVGDGDILVVLISGGGSALLPAPTPPITLEDTLTLTRLLARSGVNILDLNMVRKQTDVLKGGGLAKLAKPAQVVSLILSDIIGDDLSLIASGPTVADPSTPGACLDLFTQVGVQDSIPPSIMRHLTYKQATQQSPDGDNFSSGEEFSHVQNVLIGTNQIACDAASSRATSDGFLSRVISTTLSGDARDVGLMFAVLARYVVTVALIMKESSAKREKVVDRKDSRLKDLHTRLVAEFGQTDEALYEIQEIVNQALLKNLRGVCLLAGGETTVKVKGQGRGGRNQEMAVTAGLELAQLFNDGAATSALPKGGRSVVFLSAGTDGQDGPTTAAGAVVDVDFVKHSIDEGLGIDSYMANNDSFTLLSALGAGSNLVNTGLTGTNVMDIQALLVELNHS